MGLSKYTHMELFKEKVGGPAEVITEEGSLPTWEYVAFLEKRLDTTIRNIQNYQLANKRMRNCQNCRYSPESANGYHCSKCADLSEWKRGNLK